MAEDPPNVQAVSRGGRPTKCTPENAAIICAAISRGLPMIHACRVAGISYATFCAWRDRDPKFVEQIDEAKANGVSSRLAIIEKAAANGDWRASAWLLEHCAPEHFSKTRVQHEHVHLGHVTHQFTVPIETLNQIAEARQRHEQQKGA